jgi:AcrR family transcriptional regulator
MIKAGRPREFDRDAALEASMLLFWRKGYESTSLSDLCEAMDIRSPSLYAAFGSKEGLYLEAFARYVKVNAPMLWDQLTTATSARAGVTNLLGAAARVLPKSRSAPAGCMATLAAVSDEWPVSVTRAAKKVRLEMLSRLRSRFDAAVADGELSATTDTEGLSRFYLSIYQGMAIQARDGASQEELVALANVTMMAWPSQDTRGDGTS